jgi:hypothetical protein
MEDGGTLGFGLRHVYPIKKGLKHVYNVLKGSDAVVYQSVSALGFEPVLYVFYDEDERNDALHGAMVDNLIDFYEANEDDTVVDVVQNEGGIPVRENGVEIHDDFDVRDPEPVEWVTPLTTHNCQEGPFASYGNEPRVNWAYGDVCMIVRIGKAGDRLAYPTVDQVNKVYRQRWDARRFGRY